MRRERQGRHSTTVTGRVWVDTVCGILVLSTIPVFGFAFNSAISSGVGTALYISYVLIACLGGAWFIRPRTVQFKSRRFRRVSLVFSLLCSHLAIAIHILRSLASGEPGWAVVFIVFYLVLLAIVLLGWHQQRTRRRSTRTGTT